MLKIAAILFILVSAVVLCRAVLRFDRRMVEAGNKRRRDAEAKARAVSAAAPLARIVELPTEGGAVQYAVRLDDAPTVYRLAPDSSTPPRLSTS